MKTIIVENLNKIKKAIPILEKNIKIKINFGKPLNRLSLKGDGLNEFIVEKILRAVDFGFDVEDALLLKKDNFLLEFINIKEHTRRKNLGEVRARVIGKEGKAIRTIEELSSCVMVVHVNEVGIIVDTDHLESVTQALISLIQGAKHGNVFSYLEKQNANLKNLDKEDLGLKKGMEKLAKDF